MRLVIGFLVLVLASLLATPVFADDRPKKDMVTSFYPERVGDRYQTVAKTTWVYTDTGEAGLAYEFVGPAPRDTSDLQNLYFPGTFAGEWRPIPEGDYLVYAWHSSDGRALDFVASFGVLDSGNGNVLEVQDVTDVTFRPLPPDVVGVKPNVSPPTDGQTGIIRCPGDGKAAGMAAFGLSESVANEIAGYWHKLGPGEGPCAWKYDAVSDGVFIDANVQNGWTVDWPGMGNGPTGPGGHVRAAVLTARFQP